MGSGDSPFIRVTVDSGVPNHGWISELAWKKEVARENLPVLSLLEA